MKKALIVVLAAIPGAAGAADKNAAEPSDPLAVMSDLVGSCWHGKFAGRETTDTHCFTTIYDGKHVLDHHRVEGGKSSYRGFSVYSWNTKEKRIDYVYFNSDGGTSRGSLNKTDTGFSFPGESYQAPDGSTRTISSKWIIDGNKWQQVTREGDQVAWQVDYQRRPQSDFPRIWED